MANEIAGETNLVRDGGARNVGRRAGMGAVMLHAVAHPQEGTHQLFDHYFQAVGSGSGAIAAWEAVRLLLADGRFGDTHTRIHMAQNLPFTPIADSWEKSERHLVSSSDEKSKEEIAAVTASVLTNRHPPYSMAGGLFDVLEASCGSTWKASNYQVFAAAREFKESEGVDIGPAAAVAVDALRQAVASSKVGKDERILLHITGGGKEIQYSDGPLYQAAANIMVKPNELAKALEAIGKPVRICNHRNVLKRYERRTSQQEAVPHSRR